MPERWMGAWLAAGVLHVAMLGGAAWAGERDATTSSQAPHVERVVKDFSLAGADGKTYTLRSWKDAKAVVLFFLGTECPVSNGYAPEMARLAEKYGKRGVLFFGVHCDGDVTAEAARTHAKEYSLAFPLLLDPELVLPPQTGARVTPECVLLSPTGTVYYHGRIDNRRTPDGRRRPEPTVRDLEAGLEAVLAGRRPAEAENKAFGCPLPTKD